VLLTCDSCLPCALQFLAGGCEISLIAAIDFTGSNGDPAEPSSLHYISPTGECDGGALFGCRPCLCHHCCVETGVGSIPKYPFSSS
jgi:hypothetical protein